MSEQRCGEFERLMYRGECVYPTCRAFEAKMVEPQEGAPSGAADCKSEPDGVPSCASPDASESAELAATAAEVYRCAVSWEADARLIGNVRAGDIAKMAIRVPGLLRMVDDLTETGAFKSATIYQQSMHITELQRERDELRAKLAEAEKRLTDNGQT